MVGIILLLEGTENEREKALKVFDVRKLNRVEATGMEEEVNQDCKERCLGTKTKNIRPR